MARYLQVTDVTRPRFDVIMVHFTVYDDSTNPDTVLTTGTHGFQAVLYDANGVMVNETLNQRLARLQNEFNAYAQRMINEATAGDAQFQQIKNAAVGYRYPPAV